MGFNERQQQAIDHRGTNLLVAAAAGSGKTAVLVERVTKLILEGDAGIDEMLVVTFTKAAAAGMKEKIVKSIRKRIREDGELGNLKNVERLKQQLALMPEANISTFDSFAQKIVRENFQSIDVDPGIRVGDENKIKLLSNQALDFLLKEELEKGGSDFIAFMDAYADLKSLESIKELIENFYANIRALDDPFGYFNEYVEALKCTKDQFVKSPAMATLINDLSVKTREVEQFTYEAENLLSDAKFNDLKQKLEVETNAHRLVAGAIEEARVAYEELMAGKRTDIDSELDKLQGAFDAVDSAKFTLRVGPALQSDLDQIKEEINAARNAYKGAVKNLRNLYFYQSLDDSLAEIHQTYGYAKTFFEIVKKYDQIFYDLKTEKGMLDFNDFMHLALKTLENEEIANQYKRKFKYIFVDEYQDSNELQDALIARLSTGDNVFMVGDVKQSIYRFRQAEPALFQSRYHRYKDLKEGGCVIDLNCNYRSKESVIKSTNILFEDVMEGYDEDAKLKRGNSYEGEHQYETEIYLVDQFQAGSSADGDSSDGDSAEENYIKDELEALEVAKIIKNAMSSGMELPYLEGEEFKTRPLKFRDIVVLRSSTKGISDTFKKIFEDQGIPLFAEQNDGYFDALEVDIFLNLLKIIDNTRQDVPLLSVLFSSIFGFTAQELAEIRIARKGREYAFYDAFFACAKFDEVLDVRKELCEKCQRAMGRIEEWKEASLMLPLTDLIWKLYRDTGYYIYTGALPGGQQRQTNLRLLAQKAQEFSQTSSGIYAFLSEIDSIRGRKIPVPPASTLGENADAVRLMTIHKSKGLEYPLVITTGLHKQLKGSTKVGKLSFNKRLGIAFPIVDLERNLERNTILSSLISAQNNLEEMKERQRLLYVAFTRAIDKLILCGVVKDYSEQKLRWDGFAPMNTSKALEAKDYLDIIMPTLTGSCNVVVEHPDALISALKKGLSERAKSLEQLMNPKNQNIREEIENRLFYKYPFAEDAKLKAKYSVSELNAGNKAMPIYLSVPENLSKALKNHFGLDEEDAVADQAMALTAAEKGTLYHLILYKMDFSNLENCSAKEVLDSLISSGEVKKEEADSIEISKIENFLKSDMAKRVSDASKQGKIYKEMPFTLKTVHDGHEILVQGIIDCCFEETDESGARYFVLLDYKSNAVRGNTEDAYNHFREMYKGQIDLYEEALASICQIPVKERYLFMLDSGKTLAI